MAATRVWSLALLLAAAWVCACKQTEEPSLLDEAHARQAAALTAALEDEAFAQSVDETLDVHHNKLEGAAFPVLQVTGTCPESVLEVRYDPYQDRLRLTLAKPGALDEQLRWVSLGAERVFEETKPFEKPAKLLDQSDEARPRTTLDKLTEQHAALFPAAKDVELDLEAETMVASRVGDKQFRYEPFVHQGWKLKLHVFSKKMAKAIAEHAKQAKRAAAELHVLDKQLGEQASKLRGSKTPAAKQVLARYDERRAAAEKRREQLQQIPHGDKQGSLSVTHDPPCD